MPYRHAHTYSLCIHTYIPEVEEALRPCALQACTYIHTACAACMHTCIPEVEEALRPDRSGHVQISTCGDSNHVEVGLGLGFELRPESSGKGLAG